jgi:molybdate transport system regulatory protein
MLNPVIRIRIDFSDSSFVGPGKIDLLEAIRDAGSLSQAARDLGMSYRRAWLLIDSFKSAFREPVTLATTGSKGGGGVTLTSFGQGLVESYRALERDIAEIAARLRRSPLRLAKDDGEARSGGPAFDAADSTPLGAPTASRALGYLPISR